MKTIMTRLKEKLKKNQTNKQTKKPPLDKNDYTYARARRVWNATTSELFIAHNS